MQLFGNRQRYCAAYAAAHNANLTQSLGFGGFTERSCKIGKIITCIFVVKLFGCCPHYLKDDPYGSLFTVEACNGKRYALAVVVGTQDNELTRLCLFGNKRRLNIHKRNRRIKTAFVYDFKHFLLSFL